MAEVPLSVRPVGWGINLFGRRCTIGMNCKVLAEEEQWCGDLNIDFFKCRRARDVG